MRTQFNFLPTNNTVQHIFNGKTYIFNDTNYFLILNTFVTFGVPYLTDIEARPPQAGFRMTFAMVRQ